MSLKKRLNEIYSKHTGKSVDQIKEALERDNFMTPDNAKDFGLIDKVVEKRDCNKVFKLIRYKKL